eukprot:360887-Chlamydomonas_euryale.AAC.1
MEWVVAAMLAHQLVAHTHSLHSFKEGGCAFERRMCQGCCMATSSGSGAVHTPASSPAARCGGQDASDWRPLDCHLYG